jgi:plasmid stabilization system protein ParE
MLRYQFHPDASLEYGEAVDYYIEINPLLADAFVAEVEHAILMIRKYPSRWRLIAGNVRRYLVHRFPFGIYYSSDCDVINIFAIMHLSRKPDYWFTRKVEE